MVMDNTCDPNKKCYVVITVLQRHYVDTTALAQRAIVYFQINSEDLVNIDYTSTTIMQPLYSPEVITQIRTDVGQ